jgi:hypothetical protein
MVHFPVLHLSQGLDLERRTAGMQESPVVQQFVTMDLGPRFDQALLGPWKGAADRLNRIKSEHCLEFLVGRVEMRPVMWRPDFWKHTDDDSKEP